MGTWDPGSLGSQDRVDGAVRTADAVPEQGDHSARRLPGRRQSAGPGEEHGRLDLHVQAQGQVPVVPFQVARASGVLKIQDGFQGLQR